MYTLTSSSNIHSSPISKEYLLYKEDLKRFLETESGGANLSYFIYGSANPNEEMTVENSEKAKREILKVCMYVVFVYFWLTITKVYSHSRWPQIRM